MVKPLQNNDILGVRDGDKITPQNIKNNKKYDYAILWNFGIYKKAGNKKTY